MTRSTGLAACVSDLLGDYIGLSQIAVLVTTNLQLRLKILHTIVRNQRTRRLAFIADRIAQHLGLHLDSILVLTAAFFNGIDGRTTGPIY